MGNNQNNENETISMRRFAFIISVMSEQEHFNFMFSFVEHTDAWNTEFQTKCRSFLIRFACVFVFIFVCDAKQTDFMRKLLIRFMVEDQSELSLFFDVLLPIETYPLTQRQEAHKQNPIHNIQIPHIFCLPINYSIIFFDFFFSSWLSILAYGKTRNRGAFWIFNCIFLMLVRVLKKKKIGLLTYSVPQC